ncbi:MAG: HAMP domain-containing protein [Firmicutes bacterium]|nr:HAMP domain-containing protein [Bacillota bacterium]
MFPSIKWRLAGTYMTIILGTLLLFSYLVFNSLENYYLEERGKTYLAHANIIAGSGQELLLSGDRNSFYWARNYGDTIDARVLMLDKTGKVLMDSFGEPWLEGRTLEHREVKSALGGKSLTGIHNIQNGKRVLYVAVPVLHDKKVYGAVMLVTGLGDLFETLARVESQLISLTLASGAAAALLSWFLAGLLTGPVKELTAGVEKMTRGKLGVRVPVRSNDEMGRLAKAFNIMSDKLGKVEQTRREFITNASHEFKSPLGSMKALAQSLLESDETDPTVYREFLADIDAEIDRLARLADELLYLVRLEEEGIKLKRQAQPVSPLVERVLGLLRSQAGARKLKMDVQQGLYWPLDADLTLRILFNLVHNAIKYTSPETGSIKVTARADGKEMVLRVQDNGEGIPPEEVPYLFDRFYRVDKARSRETGGAGLGLSIVKQAAQLQDGRIEVVNRNGNTVFEVKIPDL